jgi:hypothetical protein
MAALAQAMDDFQFYQFLSGLVSPVWSGIAPEKKRLRGEKKDKPTGAWRLVYYCRCLEHRINSQSLQASLGRGFTSAGRIRTVGKTPACSRRHASAAIRFLARSSSPLRGRVPQGLGACTARAFDVGQFAAAESPLTQRVMSQRIQPRSRCRAARDLRGRGFQRGSPAGARRCGIGVLILGGAT